MEELKGLNITITKLSDRKVRLDYEAQLICEEMVIESLHLKVRYKLDLNDGIYKMIYPRSQFLNQISNRLRVKKKFIQYGTIWSPRFVSAYTVDTNKFFEIDGLKFNNLIKSIYIDDIDWYKVWNRDQQINNLLK